MAQYQPCAFHECRAGRTLPGFRVELAESVRWRHLLRPITVPAVITAPRGRLPFDDGQNLRHALSNSNVTSAEHALRACFFSLARLVREWTNLQTFVASMKRAGLCRDDQVWGGFGAVAEP